MSTSKYFIILCFFFTLYFKSLTASFSFNNFPQNSTFHSDFTLDGNAKVVNNGSSLQLTAGSITYKKPINFYSGIPKKTVSFSTYFSFSISGNGDGLAFVVFSDGYPFDGNGLFGIRNGSSFKFLSVEFDTFMDEKYGDVNGNHVGIDLCNFVSLKVVNLSSVGLRLNSGTRLQVWIDYESGSKRLEVRLNKFGENRPVNPLLFERIDLGKMWPKNEGFYVGLSSFSGNFSSQVCNVYSWSFKARESPDWMHSKPLDPIVFKEGVRNEIKIHKENDCVVWIVSAFMFGIGLGALGSFVGVFMWMIFAKRRPVLPEDYAVKPVVDK